MGAVFNTKTGKLFNFEKSNILEKCLKYHNYYINSTYNFNFAKNKFNVKTYSTNDYLIPYLLM